MKAVRFLGMEAGEWQDLSYIIRRNVLLLTNGVIAVVVVLLLVFGDVQAGIFLGVVLCVNMLLGLGQDLRAWYALKKLQLLTAPRVIRLLADGKEESVLTEDIEKGDTLKLKTGDEVPCDGILIRAQSLELSESLLTGEAASFARQSGARILGGSIVTAGTGIFETETVFRESRIARMTEGLKSYSVSESPIQKAVNQVIQYAGYLLIAAIIFVLVRGSFAHESQLTVVKNIGALASALVPQGLAFAMTLLFAYGAAHLYRRNVLLQEVNATEKLGRIKNLCMDKTGTLTENAPTVESVAVPPGVVAEDALAMTLTYIEGSGDVSQTMLALKKYSQGSALPGSIVAVRAFSSWRSYGALEWRQSTGETVVLVAGAPEFLSLHFSLAADREWFTRVEATAVNEGKRIFCLAQAHTDHLPDDMSTVGLRPLAVFTLSSQLRPGIIEAITFFQERGVHIRIISGDHPETVRTVATLAGVKHCDQLITGKEMTHWTDEDFLVRAKEYSLFARTLPEQKEKIIVALKRNGFTAMVGDGANDALAIKKADLGIAMFEGAPATRKLASVVLMNNSFTALPPGVELAESIIKNAEIFASLFFAASLTSLLLFLGVSGLGYPFPLTPLNVTLINYFTVGFPGILLSYWTIRPTVKMSRLNNEPFLRRVAPFVLLSALLQAVVLMMVFITSPEDMKLAPSNLWVVIASAFFGYLYFLFAPAVYRGTLLFSQRRDLLVLSIIEVFFCGVMLLTPFLQRFFEIFGVFSWSDGGWIVLIIFSGYGVMQRLVAFFVRRSANVLPVNRART